MIIKMEKAFLLILIIIQNFVIFSQNYPKPDFFALATIDSIYDGNMRTEEFKQQKKLLLISDKNNLEIRGFKVLLNVGGFREELLSINEYFTDEMLQFFSNYKGVNVLFTEILAVLDNKDTFSLNNIYLRVDTSTTTRKIIPKKVFNPVFANINSCSISRLTVFSNLCIEPDLISKDLKIVHFELTSLTWDGFYGFYTSKNELITNQQKLLISQWKNGQYFFFYQIKATTIENDTILLTPIVFTLTD